MCVHERKGVKWLVRESLLDQNALGWWFFGVTLSPRPCKAEINVFSEGAEWKWLKEWNERVHKFYSSALVFAGTVNFFFPTSRGVPGVYTDKRQTVTDTWNTPKKCLFWLKEAERGWKSGATPLSWKSGWKPLTRREFWAQRGSGSFFRFRDMAVWSWFSCAIKFYIVIFRLCSSALYSTWYSRGLTAVLGYQLKKHPADRNPL